MIRNKRTTRTRQRRLLWGVVVAILTALAFGTAACGSSDPYVGNWRTVDDPSSPATSNLKMQIEKDGASYEVTVTTSGAHSKFAKRADGSLVATRDMDLGEGNVHQKDVITTVAKDALVEIVFTDDVASTAKWAREGTTPDLASYASVTMPNPAPVPTPTPTAVTPDIRFFHNSAYGYVVDYDSSLVARCLDSTLLKNVRRYLGGKPDLVLIPRDGTGAVFVTACLPLGNSSYSALLNALPQVKSTYERSVRSRHGSVKGAIVKVGGWKALSFRSTNPMPGGYWNRTLMVLTSRGWITVQTYGSGSRPPASAQPLLDAADSLSFLKF